ncbi:MAG: hypothetical protein U1F43_33120 [Myxococcota bacterium]
MSRAAPGKDRGRGSAGADDDAARRTLGERVVYALLRPAARVALAFCIPLKQLRDRLQMAYFHEARDRGLKLREVADILDVSPRSAALLSKQLKENFLDVEAEVALPRRLEFLLWAEPLSSARLKQVLGDVAPAAIDEALARLESEGRVIREGTRWSVVRGAFRLVDEKGWLSRIDGLDTLLGTIASAAWSRFFGAPEQQERSFARNLALRIRPADVAALKQLYEKTLWPTLSALDEAAKGKPDAIPIDLALLWAPQDAVRATPLPKADPPPDDDDGDDPARSDE